MTRITAKQAGRTLAQRTRETAFQMSKWQYAKVANVTNWGTAHITCTLESTGETVYVEAAGSAIMQEIVVGDYVWLRKMDTGARNKWLMVGFAKTAAGGGSYVPTLRYDINTKIHELWASDQDPQALDTDAAGIMTVLVGLKLDDGAGDSPAIELIGGSNDDTISLFLEDDGTATDSDLVVKLADAAGDSKLLIRDSGDADVFSIDSDGNLIALTKVLPLPLATGGGTSDIAAFNGAPSINLDADTETFYATFRTPSEWDAASNLALVLMVANEIAEDDGDDVSITCQVRGYADGETTGDAGQTVACVLNLTGGDEAINVVNRVTGAIVYNDGTYPIAAGDVVVIKATVNLGGAGECTGPLHVVGMWVEYTATRWGE